MTEMRMVEDELVALLGVARTLGGSIELDTVLKLVVDSAKSVMDVEAASLLLVDALRSELYFHVAEGEKGERIRTIRLAMGEGIAGGVAQSGRPEIVNSVQSDPRFAARFDKASGFRTREILAVPLSSEGKTVGVLELINRRRSGGFDSHDLQMAELMAGQAAVAITTAQLHQRILESERMAAVGQAVAGLAHCIKNILNGVKGGSYLVDKALAKDDPARLASAWTIVKNSNERMFGLVMDMLTYSKERAPEYVECDANELCRSVCDLMAPKAVEKSAVIDCQLDPGLGRVVIDDKGIHRCLMNLVSNAVDACPEAGGVVTVRTEPALPARFLISVRDNGCGIKPEHLTKLFQSFFSTKGSKGTGLGLPVTHKIVREHGGRIDIESELGKGTVFTMCLPKQPPAPAEPK